MITDLKMWRDPGYTEGCMEVPHFGESLPAPDYTYSEDISPSKDRYFTEFRLPVPYEGVFDMCYLQLTYEWNNATSQTFYGWIDAVILNSDTEGFPMVTVSWHVDYWRTFASGAVYGSGMVKRRPASATIPPQSYPCRYWLPGGRENISDTNNTNVWWVLIRYNQSGTTASSWWVTYPISSLSPSSRLKVDAQGVAPSADETMSAKWDELIGVSPDSISAVYLSHVPPFDYDGNGTTDHITIKPSRSGIWATRVIGECTVWQSDGADTFDAITKTFSLGRSFTTTDTTTCIVTGYDGEPIGTLPWGITVSSVEKRVIASTDGCAVEFRFLSNTIDDEESNAMGCVFVVSNPALDLCSNAWSSYVYSGAREAEIRQRELNTEAQAVQGGISTGTSAVSGALSGAMMGAMAGAVGGPVGMAAGAIIGGVGSALAGALTTGGNYLYQTNTLNDQMQAVSDYKASRQLSTPMLSGQGMDVMFNGIGGCNIITMDMESYSEQQRENDIALYGANVSEPMESCQTLIEEGGPLQIQNLVVRGDIPSSAKSYLRDRFARGVRIV